MMRYHSVAALVLGIALLMSCATGDKRPSRDTASVDSVVAETTQATEIREPTVGSTDTAIAFAEGFYQVQHIPNSPQDTIIEHRMRTPDGWVFAPSLDLSDTAATPELVVRADSSANSPMVAYVDFVGEHDGGWRDIYAVNDSTLHGNLDRLGDDEYGLPGLGVRGGWAHVIYGYTSAGEPRTGWVRLVPGKVEYTHEQAELDE